MCNSYCLLNSFNTNKFAKYSFILNIIQLIINFLIIICTLLCFISCNLDLIIRTGYSYYIKNILYCLLTILIILLIFYYQNKNLLIKDKKQTCFILICLSASMNFMKCFTTLFLIGRVKRIYRTYKNQNKYYYGDEYNLGNKQTNLLLIYILILFGLFLFLGIFWLIYLYLLYNLRVIILNNDFNNVYNNRTNNSYISTKPDFEDNSQEIVINSLNDGNKNNNFIYFSQKIINNIEKEYEDKECQTIIKGIISK